LALPSFETKLIVSVLKHTGCFKFKSKYECESVWSVAIERLTP